MKRSLVIHALALVLDVEKIDRGFYLPIGNKGDWGLFFGENDSDFKGLRRRDGKFFAIIMKDMGGWDQPYLHEEPAKLPREDGVRIVGTIDILYNDKGEVIVRDTVCVDGSKDIELLPSSVSKGELPQGEVLPSYLKLNLKRLAGDVNVHLRKVDESFVLGDGQRWMSLAAFLKDSHDNRCKGAVAHAAAHSDDFRAAFIKAVSG